jgi:mannose-6-phosphate isomerase-like protein (cupin superfamily)
MDVIDLADKLARFDDCWAPRVVAQLNGQHVKLAKLDGAFVWHAHEAEDELFLVVAGRLRMELRDAPIELGPGQLCVVPRGVEHRPVALDGVCSVLLFEPASTVNTGDAGGERTVTELEWI